MGGKQSVPVQVQEAAKNDTTNWGEPPEEVPESEKGLTDLVLQAWAYCKAKPSGARAYRSDKEERDRRMQLSWRKRTSFIELDCGEDSFFVSNTYKAVGVADGVGGWRDEGVDPSYFANSLMENAKLFSETHRDVTDPEVILQSAFDKVLNDKKVKAGSSTACLATLRDADGGKHVLDVANIGDSGLLVVRNRQILHRVHEKVHGFNTPFQLAVLPKHLQGRAFSDRVSDAVREKIEVQHGDVVVLGTDGLFDNRFNAELADDAGWVGKVEENVVAKIPLVGFLLSAAFASAAQENEFVDPYRIAQRMVAGAYKTSLSKTENSPWASMLRQLGVKDAKGGKADDITVLLCRVSTREELSDNVVW